MDRAEVRVALERQLPDWRITAQPVEAAPRLGYVPSEGAPPLDDQEEIARRAVEDQALGRAGPAVPGAHDLRDVRGRNFITQIADQGACLSCVAFATCAAIEGTAQLQRDDPGLGIDLSEAHLFYCVAQKQARHCQGASGGWSPKAALTACRDQGVPEETCFPYTPGDQPCASCWDWHTGVTRISGWCALNTPAEMKAWIASRGPLMASMKVYQDFEYYGGGVYRRSGVGDELGGHCVCVVGYDDDEGYWIGKNSWGSEWGEEGFFRIAYGDCAIDSAMLGVDAVQPQWLEKLAEILSRPASRKSFALDPASTLARAGIAESDVPSAMLETLTDLSYEELQVIARVRLKLTEAGADLDFLGRVH